MKTTLELPGELLRQIKAEAAREGRSMKELVVEALHEHLRTRRSAPGGWRAVAGKAPQAAISEIDRHLADLERVDPKDWR